MYELFLTYWFSWILYIVIVFFMKKSKFRSLLVIWLLLVLVTFPMYIAIDTLQISICLVLLLTGAIIFYVQEKVTVYRLIVTFTISIGYTGILIWENITPVWFFMPPFFMIAILLVCINIVMMKQMYEQIAAVLVGVLFGHILYDLLLIGYSLQYKIGNNAYLVICLTILMLMFIHMVKNFYQKCIYFLHERIS